MRRIVVAIALAVAAPAAADKRDADALFNKAKKLHAAKRYAEACPLFEQTDALDPGIGAKLNVARCYEDWGMLARAYRWYTDAEAMARAANDKRADQIKELIAAIDSDVPRLTVNLPPGVDAAAIELKLDGKPAVAIVGKAQLLDPGPHELAWVVDGQKKSKLIPLERGGERELTLDIRAVATRKRTPAGGDEPPAPGRTRRILGIVAGATGVVGLGIATYLTLDARSTYNDALDMHCMGATNMCNDEGLAITSDARSQANIATAITVVSLAAIGGGIALYLTAPKREQEPAKTVYVTPVVGDGVGGIVVGGGF